MIKANEKFALVGTVDPDVLTATDHDTDVIDMSKFDRVVFIIAMGTLGSSATVDFSVFADAASGGSYATELEDYAITQMTQAGTDESDRQVIVEVEALPVLEAGKRYIKGRLTVGTASCDGAVIALGFNSQYQPSNMYDLASVAEIVG